MHVMCEYIHINYTGMVCETPVNVATEFYTGVCIRTEWKCAFTFSHLIQLRVLGIPDNYM